MDEFSGYNQIRMTKEDKKKTTFITSWGTLCSKVMPFGLKNVGARSLRSTIWCTKKWRSMWVLYLENPKKKKDQVEVLWRLFERLQKYQLKLNPAKCLLGVRTRKLLSFIVSGRGIKVDPDKAIQEMPVPKTERELRSFFGLLDYIAQFISQLTVTFELIFRLLKKKNIGV